MTRPNPFWFAELSTRLRTKKARGTKSRGPLLFHSAECSVLVAFFVLHDHPSEFLGVISLRLVTSAATAAAATISAAATTTTAVAAATAATTAATATVAAATTAAAATVTAASTTAAATAVLTRASFVHYQRTSVLLLLVQGIDGFLRCIVISHFNKAEALAPTRVAVLDDLRALHGPKL